MDVASGGGPEEKSTWEWLDWYTWYKANCPDNPGSGAATMISMINYQIKEDMSKGQTCKDVVTSAVSPMVVYMPEDNTFLIMSVATLFYQINKKDLSKVIPMWADFKKSRGNPISLFGSMPEQKDATRLVQAQIVKKLAPFLSFETTLSKGDLSRYLSTPEQEYFLRAGPARADHPFIREMNRDTEIARMPPGLTERAQAYLEATKLRLRQTLRPVTDLASRGATMFRNVTSQVGIKRHPHSEWTRAMGLSPALRMLVGTSISLGAGYAMMASYSNLVMDRVVGYGTNIDGEKIFFSNPETICEEFMKGRMPDLEKKIPMLLELKKAIDLNTGSSTSGAAAPNVHR